MTENSEQQEQPAPAPNDSLIGDPPKAEESAEEDTSEETDAPAEEEFVPLGTEDLTFAEGFEVQEEIRDEFLELMNNQEMTPKDRAQALVDLQQKVALEASEAVSRQWADEQKAWQSEVKNDPELGGGNFQTHIGKVNSLVEQFGSTELVEVLRLTGAGNNVHVHRFLGQLADIALEGSPRPGMPAGNEATRAEKLFPSMKKG